MKKLILLVVLGMACSAWAQAPAQKKPAKPEAARSGAAKPVKMAKKSRRHQDARHCLEKGDNTAIIKCAEEYL